MKGIKVLEPEVRKNYGPLYSSPMAIWFTLFFLAPIGIVVVFSFLKSKMKRLVLIVVSVLICGGMLFVASSCNKGSNVKIDQLVSDSRVAFSLMIPSVWKFNFADDSGYDHALEITCSNGNIYMIAYEYYLGEGDLDFSTDTMPEWFKDDEAFKTANYWFDMSFYDTKEDFDFDDGGKGYCLKSKSSTLRSA